MKQLVSCLLLCVAAPVLAQAPLDATHPDLTGVWHRIGYIATAKPDGAAAPPLLPEAATLYAKHQSASEKGDRGFDTSTICLPEGVPRLMLKAEPFEILQRPTLVAFAYQINRLSRVAYFNEAPSEENPDYYLGQSTARWDGKTLVIDTRGFNDATLLDDSGLPHSEELKVTERLQLDASGRRLTNRITIDDPSTYRKPWTLTVHYERMANYQLPEDVCAERVGGSRPKSRRP